MKNNNEIQQALNSALSSLHVSDTEASMLLAQAKGGKKVKKKISLAMIFLVVLIIGTMTGLALTIEWKDAAVFLKKERQGGSFSNWTAEEQATLVDSLVKEGHITENDDVKMLRSNTLDETKQSELAQRIMMDWLSKPVEHVAFRSIMEKLWGDFRSWSVEQKVWLTAVQKEAGVLATDNEVYVMPTKDDLGSRAAIHLARAYASVWMNIPFDVISSYSESAEFVIFPKPVKQGEVVVYTTEGGSPVWFVELESTNYDNYPNYICAEINPVNGEVNVSNYVQGLRSMAYGSKSWPEIAKVTEDAMKAQDYQPLMEWSHEEKAKWSNEIRPMVLDQQDGIVIDSVTVAYSHYEYGMPDEKSIKQEEAVDIAKHAILKSLKVDEQALANYDKIYVYYDVTDSSLPKWRFRFSATGKVADLLTNMHPEKLVIYSVELNAYTGEIITLGSAELCDNSTLSVALKLM